jgi:hypothetical protein
MDVPEQEYKRIAEEIYSEQSPVGIDAQKTHVMILYTLERIAARLKRLEAAQTSD